MKTFNETKDFDKSRVTVVKKGLDDANFDEDIEICLCNSNGTCNLVLRPLWNTEYADEEGYKQKYNFGDYFQQAIISSPIKRGLGALMHDFLIMHASDFEIYNVFSTYEIEDGYNLNTDATKFWKSRADKKKADFNNSLKRYQILFQKVK
jgi:5-hydroxyisourate hydrolase-like protein (transthyretin family)